MYRYIDIYLRIHCVKSVNSNIGKYEPEISPYWDTFHAVICTNTHYLLFKLDKVYIIYSSIYSSIERNLYYL